MEKKFTPKKCRMCDTTFTPMAPCNLYCSKPCADKAAAIKAEAKKRRAYQKWADEQVAKGRGWVVGVGKGGSQPKYKDHPKFSSGMGRFSKLKHEVKARGFCERCSKDLRDAAPYHWCCHHRDHDRTNNEIENLELLCKRCHQIEHECWKAFEGATTIPE